jgi:5-formyltetrahydrofolate cyclo-ligase
MTAQAGSVSFPSMSHPRDPSRDALRREMRQRRRSVSGQDRAIASRQFRSIADRNLLFHPGMRIAMYLAYGHEASCASLIELAMERRCTVYVPRIVSYRQGRMRFMAHHPAMKLVNNRHGIAEPIAGTHTHVAIRSLDAVVLPVVAVDQRGYRLGSGAGFYDRALQHLRHGRQWRRPKLIALAYEFQVIGHLRSQSWDVPVDQILTDRRLYRIPTAHRELQT